MSPDLFWLLVWLSLWCGFFAVAGWLGDRFDRLPPSRQEELLDKLWRGTSK